ncbi:T9SS type A sorting domain-containing protein [Marivirga lumbricoides]
MNYKYQIIFIFIFILPNMLQCQKTTKNWLFFNQLRFEFIEGTAKFNFNSPSLAEDDRTTVFSHPQTGELLLYFDGINLWSGNELNLVKENIKIGSGLRQTSLILPLNESFDSFYLFTCQTNFDDNGLLISSDITYSYISRTDDSYSIDSLNLELESNVSPNVTAYPITSGNGFWLLLHSFSGNDFIIYQVNSDGVFFHDKQSKGFSIPDSTQNRTGTLNFSPNGKYIVNTHWSSDNSYRPPIDLLSFNAEEGSLGTYYPLNKFLFQYVATFSPDSKKLYVSVFDSSANKELHFIQYSLEDILTKESYTFNQVEVSTIDGYVPFFVNKHLQTGLDGRLYFSGNNTNRLYRIDNPNESIENLRFSYITYPDNGFNFKAFPNFMQYEFEGLTTSDNPILNCSEASMYIIYPNPTSGVVNIKISETCFKPFNLTLVSANGQVIFKDMKFQTSQSFLKLPDNASGVYFLIFNNGVKVITKKIVII